VTPTSSSVSDMKALTMNDLRKKGEDPLSPRDRHHLNVGTGNYNRFSILDPAPRGRNRIHSKRKLDEEPLAAAPKTPKLDSNAIFSQLKASEEAVTGIKDCFKDALTIGENCYSSADGGQGEAFFKLAKTVELLIANQENMFSLMVDAVKVIDSAPIPSYSTMVSNGGVRRGNPPSRHADSTPSEDQRPKKVKQAISRAEKSVTLFDLDLGSVPVLNKETLSRKVTILLHEKARSTGIYKGNPEAAAESMDDILSCATIDFLGKGTKMFFNRKDANDPRNNKMCTVPVKLTFKDKETRFRAELTLKKACNVRCGTPYPKKLRTIMDNLVKECKTARPKSFILAKVDSDKLCVTTRARNDSGWEDLPNVADIPLDILDADELAAASGGAEEVDMQALS
jgi:hypothetical protein